MSLSPVSFLIEKLDPNFALAQAPALPEALAFWGTATAATLGHHFVNRVFTGAWGKPANSASALLKTTAISIGAGMVAEAGAVFWGDPSWTAATALFVAGAGMLATALVRERDLKPWHAARVAQMKQEHLDRVAKRLPELERLTEANENKRQDIFEELTEIHSGSLHDVTRLLYQKNELYAATGQNIVSAIYSALPDSSKPHFIAWILDHYEHTIFLDRTTKAYRKAREFVTELGKSYYEVVN